MESVSEDVCCCRWFSAQIRGVKDKCTLVWKVRCVRSFSRCSDISLQVMGPVVKLNGAHLWDLEQHLSGFEHLKSFLMPLLLGVNAAEQDKNIWRWVFISSWFERAWQGQEQIFGTSLVFMCDLWHLHVPVSGQGPLKCHYNSHKWPLELISY